MTGETTKWGSILSLSTSHVLLGSIVVRGAFLLFGTYQDAHMAVKYTDIDYLVFSDAATYVFNGESPYSRETYRYTPLLSWMLVPNAYWPDFGKIVFIICDLLTGFIILKTLELTNLSEIKRSILSSIWLLNPMVITISTRGSSESVLTVFVMLFVYFLLKKQAVISGIFCGLSIHFKIYPIIYIPTAFLFLSNYRTSTDIIFNPLCTLNQLTIKFALACLTSFISLGALMYVSYGYEFLEHSYFYHFIRTDHRHNFSVYNVSLYFTSALSPPFFSSHYTFDLSKLAFFPQLFLSTMVVPLLFTKKSLTDTFFLQTFTFVTFNKVMTSQYFVWFLIFLPLCLRNSSLISTRKVKGLICLMLWAVTQGFWLFFAYNLEFLGQNTFFPGLLGSASVFFLANVYVLGVFMDDTSSKRVDTTSYI